MSDRVAPHSGVGKRFHTGKQHSRLRGREKRKHSYGKSRKYGRSSTSR